MNQPAFQQESTWTETKETMNSQEDVLQALKLFGAEEGPGKFLKKLRELADRPEASFAAELGISLHQLKSMESDDFANLPAPIYMKSYYQRYCSIIGVEDEDFLRVYEVLRQGESPQLNRVSIKDNSNESSFSFAWLKYVGGIAVVGLVIFLIQSLDFSGVMSGSDGEAGSQEIATELSIPQRKVEEALPIEP